MVDALPDQGVVVGVADLQHPSDDRLLGLLVLERRNIFDAFDCHHRNDLTVVRKRRDLLASCAAPEEPNTTILLIYLMVTKVEAPPDPRAPHAVFRRIDVEPIVELEIDGQSVPISDN